MSSQDIDRIVRNVPLLLEVPASRFWVDYDADADVLYASFRKPQRAIDSELREDVIIAELPR